MVLRRWPVCLALALLLALPKASSAGENQGGDEEEFLDEFALLEEAGVVELAARHKQEIGMSPSAITVITREDIQASGANSIPGLLRIVPGMEVVLPGISTGTIGARLHWSDENHHFLVLIDGREANIELLGQAAWEVQPIFLEDLERIEIIRGPGSALYGANAVAGVVSITTRAITEKSSGWAMASAGEVGTTRLGTRASARMGNWGFSASGGVDLFGKFTDLRAPGLQMWKVHALAEHRWSDSARLLIDGTLSDGSGPRSTAIGNLDIESTTATLRLAHESEDLRGQIFWYYTAVTIDMNAPLDFKGIRLARLVPATIDSHTVDGEIQWTLPELWDPLLLIAGGRVRFSWLSSDDLLDADTFGDINSSGYRQAGVSHWEMRGGAFVHGELSPADWMTVTAGVRLDYNTETGTFLSPRLAAVFRPASGQFLRLAVARAFRKPPFLEAGIHLNVTFPDESPIVGTAHDDFREFMTRVIGNGDLSNEDLVSFEAGYLGRFLDDRLSVALDLYCNLYRNRITMVSNILPDEQGLPDLKQSSFMYQNGVDNLDIIGSELAIRFNPSRSVALLASWTHKEVYRLSTSRWIDEDPKNLITLGGRFRTEAGLLGSLYVFTRSEYRDPWVSNPAGLLEPLLEQSLGNVMLLLGKLGWKWLGERDLELEGGVKIFLPLSPFSGPLFRYYDKGGGFTPAGAYYGASELGRVVSAYLQGSF